MKQDYELQEFYFLTVEQVDWLDMQSACGRQKHTESREVSSWCSFWGRGLENIPVHVLPLCAFVDSSRGEFNITFYYTGWAKSSYTVIIFSLQVLRMMVGNLIQNKESGFW